ncbi:spore germination protein [Hathewaya limosa]|uniref:Type IV secretory pathway VirB2 component (Pilin) n=1 Tax=Hathewaya limosa TaxID=1536 RepID=A0ABU0JS91_HATLI|nr:spore germination protein [Hathewaya limosa]MDQ0479961.1 type IV secretory pathway VirB2 component (pilin) [Hathewaya limosa]
MNDDKIKSIENTLKGNFDLKWRKIIKDEGMINFVFIDNLCDTKYIADYIVKPIISYEGKIDGNIIKNQLLDASIVGEVEKEKEIILHILSGDLIIISNYFNDILFCEAKGFVRRSVSVPPAEAVIKGPREGFTETIVDNVSLIRRKVKNENLKFETFIVGKNSNTSVALCYIKDVAPTKIVSYIRNKLQTSELDFILDINYIEEGLNRRSSVFETSGYSEKPDIIASQLFEGRIAIIVDGTPAVLTLPYFFIENFQSPDDYYFNKHFVNFIRMQRWIAFFISILLPGMYLAITTYHFSLIPTIFVFRLANSRAGVPFPTIVELLLMISFFQLLREAGLRIPVPVGSSISIVGSLILGEAAVGAGLASESTVIIVALCSIATSLTPKLYNSIAIWSLIIIGFSALLGLPGFYLGFFVLISSVGSLKSCDYPYLFPLTTTSDYKLRDIIFRGKLKNISKDFLKKDEE